MNDRQIVDEIADELIQGLYKSLFEKCFNSTAPVDELLKSLTDPMEVQRRRVEQIRTVLHRRNGSANAQKGK